MSPVLFPIVDHVAFKELILWSLVLFTCIRTHNGQFPLKMTYIRKKRELNSLKRGIFSIMLSIQFSRIAGNNVKIFKN